MRDLKFCSKCKALRPLEEFYRRSSYPPISITKSCSRCRKRDCLRARHRTYRLTPEEQRERHRQYIKNRREKLIALYGGKCECCNVSHPHFLCFDHVRNNGAEERRLLKGYGVYRKMLMAGVKLDDYRLLCYSCNMARSIYGICPHEQERIRNSQSSSGAEARDNGTPSSPGQTEPASPEPALARIEDSEPTPTK